MTAATTPEVARPMTLMSSQRRRIAAGALLAAATMVVTTACGGDGGKTDGKDGNKAGTAGFNAAVNKVANPSDKKGGELKFIGSQEADSWDPQRGYYGFVWDFARYYTRQLVTFKAEPGAASTELVPDLATDSRQGLGRRPDLHLHAEGRGHLGGRQADHLQGHQVRHRAHLGPGRHLRRPDLPPAGPGPQGRVQGPVQGHLRGQARPQGDRDPGRQDHHLQAAGRQR